LGILMKRTPMTKTIGAVIIFFICILMFPVAIGLIGGVFGVVVGVFGAVFGAIFGIIGGLFGAIFGFIGWLFEGLFGWSWHGPFGFNDCNILTWAIVFLVVALLVKGKRGS
jgi:hypothetical protein